MGWLKNSLEWNTERINELKQRAEEINQITAQKAST